MSGKWGETWGTRRAVNVAGILRLRLVFALNAQAPILAQDDKSVVMRRGMTKFFSQNRV